MADQVKRSAYQLGRLEGLAEAFIGMLDGEELTEAPSALARRWGGHTALGVDCWPEDAPGCAMTVLFQLAPDELEAFVDAVERVASGDLDPDAEPDHGPDQGV